MKPALTPEQHDSYQRDGFLILENFFAPSELEILYADLNGVIENWAKQFYSHAGVIENERERERICFL